MSKKTESIEIRVSPELKSDLAQRAEGAGRSMSELVRGLIEREVAGAGDPEPQPGVTPMFARSLTRVTPALLVMLPVFALAALYLVSAQGPAVAASEFRVFFAELDRDGDRQVTVQEYTAFLEADEWEAEPDCAEVGEPCTPAALAADEIARIDGDADGAIAYGELEAFLLRERAETFLELDVNANGFVTLDEMALTEAYWRAEDGEEVSAACTALLEAETSTGAAETCGAEEEL
ncbi:MAG: hypothetical protein AAFW69_01050, partial [Pseudomonadota bacterium]